jgi:hypothetical protein
MLPHAHRVALVAATVAVAVCAAPALSQNTPGGNLEDNSGLNGSLSRADLEKLGGDHPKDRKGDVPKDPVLARSQAKAQAAKLVDALHASCEIDDARLVVAGTRRLTPGGKEVDTRVYEVACRGRGGYLLETQGSDLPVGISCLHAEEARAADEAQHKETGFFCSLPANKDVHSFVSSLIASAKGTSCSVQQLQYFGRSESTQTEYSEVICADGKGFLLRMPLLGSSASDLIMSCKEAAQQGIKCRLTDAGPVETPVTLDTFKEALAHNGVACKIDQLRTIGQEDHRKRYVVEYRCADAASGAISFIPLPGNASPFESMTCSEAASQGLACVLSGKP